MTAPRKALLAATLWVVLAFTIWNVIFDRVLVLAGRRYVAAATASAQHGVYLKIDDAMRPAIRRGVWLATASTLPVAVFGVAASWWALRRYRRNTSSKNDSARSSRL